MRSECLMRLCGKSEKAGVGFYLLAKSCYRLSSHITQPAAITPPANMAKQ